MNLSINPNWRDQSLKCHFCKETRSVKYKSTIIEGNEEKEVHVCNKCAAIIVAENDQINNK